MRVLYVGNPPLSYEQRPRRRVTGPGRGRQRGVDVAQAIPIADRFWTRVDKDGPLTPGLDACWLWTGYTRKDGYGALGLGGGRGAGTVLAYVFAYELLVGPVVPGLTLDHLCHSPTTCDGGRMCPHRRCVNPSHLEQVTRAENVMRGGSFGPINAAKTHCPSGHPYDQINTYIDPRNGWRRCRACNRNRSNERRARRAK